jgi:hypothetical protein
MHCFGWGEEMINKKGTAIFSLPYLHDLLGYMQKGLKRVTILQMRMIWFPSTL